MVCEFLSRVLSRILISQNVVVFFALAIKHQYLVLAFLLLPADLHWVQLPAAPSSPCQSPSILEGLSGVLWKLSLP